MKVDPLTATVFEFGATSLVVTRSSLLFIVQADAISSLSGRLSSFARLSGAGWQVSQHLWRHTFALYFLLSPHDLKNLRVIKEHLMGKVMLGFTESNSNMAFAITDIVIWFFILASKYMMHFTEF